MSGGFFRGTSADQDTRFSNKQAKLMKSQKFPSELEHLVDITKVKMDVMKPWIAQRVTELLGFEDEVLINFIYGLLDGKAINGKEVQISLTGFMEKNTGKFMKELWQLLLSAQNNASGVPQQLLDAKAEETKKIQVESERIKSEMQKKQEKEGREMDEEKKKNLDRDAGMKRDDLNILELGSKRHPEASDDRELFARNGARGKNRVSRSPHSPGGGSLSPRNRRSRSMSKSFSNSRSYSEERRKPRGLSRSPTSRRRSISSERERPSRPRRSITPRRKYSPPRSRRRSTSRSRRISPSPVRHRLRSPIRSRSPIRRRSRTPVRYRSRSPVRRRYPSPPRRRYRRSPSTPPRRSPSPIRRRSPVRNRRGSPRYRSRSREALSPPPPVRRLSSSPVRKRSPKPRGSPVRSPNRRTRVSENSSPVHRAPRHVSSDEDSDEVRERPAVQRPSVILRSPQRDNFRGIVASPSPPSPKKSQFRSKSPAADSRRRSPIGDRRSPQRDTRVQTNTRRKAASPSPSPKKSQVRSKSPADSRRRSPSEDRSPYKSPPGKPKERQLRDVRASPPQNLRDQNLRHDSPDAITKKGEIDRVRYNGNQKLKPSERSVASSKPDMHKDLERERSAGRRPSEIRNRTDDGVDLRKKELESSRSEKPSAKVLHPEDSDKEKVSEKIRPLLEESKHIKRLPETDKKTVKLDEKVRSGSLSSDSDDNLKRNNRKDHEYKKHRRSGKEEVTSDDSSDSEIEDRKLAKKRKKEEKKSRKEERRRRREERHRRREERRAEKIKNKLIDADDADETVPDQKKLEIELREKALESLRAKKGAGH